MEKNIFLEDEVATVAFGQQLASIFESMSKGVTLYLEGTLGAGKTTFCRGVLTALGHSGAVKSPTYTLVEPYEQTSLTVYHFDLYRLADAEELEYMGIRDYFSDDAIRLIEWPGRGEGILPLPDLTLCFSVSGSGRAVNIQANSSLGETIIQMWG